MMETTKRFRDKVQEYLLTRYAGPEHPCFAGFLADHLNKVEFYVRWCDNIERRIGSLSRKKILEIGSGMGEASAAMAKRNAIVYALEPSPVFQDIAGTLFLEENVTILQIRGDARQLCLRDDSIDFCVCSQVIEHIPDYELCLKEVFRVLKPGGYVFIDTPNGLHWRDPHSGLRFVPWLSNRLAGTYVKLRGRRAWEQAWDVWPRTERGVKRLVEQIGFREVRAGTPAVVYSSGWKGAVKRSRILQPLLTFRRRLLFVFRPGLEFLCQKPAQIGMNS